VKPGIAACNAFKKGPLPPSSITKRLGLVPAIASWLLPSSRFLIRMYEKGIRVPSFVFTPNVT